LKQENDSGSGKGHQEVENFLGFLLLPNAQNRLIAEEKKERKIVKEDSSLVMATHLVQQLTGAEQVDNTIQDNAYNTSFFYEIKTTLHLKLLYYATSYTIQCVKYFKAIQKYSVEDLSHLTRGSSTFI
jgi:hypothetical protein